MTIFLRNSVGYEFAFTSIKLLQSYEQVIGDLDEGQYQYVDKVISAGERDRTGQFIVMPLHLEQRQKQANHQLLYKLADMHDGALFYPSEIEDLQHSIQRLESKTLSYSHVHLSELLNQRWIFILLLVFLSLNGFCESETVVYNFLIFKYV